MKKIAAVTGAAAGIGAEIARQLIAEGYLVYGLDREPVAGSEIIPLAVEITDPTQIQSAFELIREQQNRLDLLVNVAGIGQFGHFEELSLAEWNQVLAVNLTGAFLTSQAALPLLKTAKHAAIVNLASVAGLTGQAYTAAYCAAKGGLVALTKSMAVEFASAGIRVNAICPAAVNTQLIEKIAAKIPESADPDLLNRMNMLLPHGVVEPAELSALVSFLASPAAKSITGIAIPVDGGVVA